MEVVDENRPISCPLLEHHNTKVAAKGDCGTVHAIANCLALFIGIGVLSSPYAVARGGWASWILNGVVAMAYFYTALLLVRCLEADPGLADYQDVSRKAFGRKGYGVTVTLLFADLLSAMVGYGISLSDNLVSAVIPNGSKLGIMGLRRRYFLTFLATLVLLPTVWVRSLRSLAWVSASSIVSSIMVVLALLWAATLDHVGIRHTIPLLRLDGLPVASGIFLFNYGANIIVPSIRTSMIDRSKFPKVLALSIAITAVFYGGVGLLGAAMFGAETESQITLNMPSGLIASKLAIWANIITALMKFSILLRPVAVEIETMLPWHPQSKAHVLFAVAMRSMLVIALILVSLSVPFFAYVVSLVGSSLSVSICLILPCCFYWKLFSTCIKTWEMALLLLLTATGVGAGIVGTIIAIVGIYESST